MHRSRTPAAAALLALAAASPSRAADDVDLQVRGNEKILGTLRPADERERFLYDAPRGALLSAAVKKAGAGGPVPTFELIDAAFNPVAGAVVTTTPTGSKLTKFALPDSALYRVRVEGDGVKDGDYQIKVKAAPRTSWSDGGTGAVPGADTQFSFAAPSGAAADVVLAASHGSAFLAHLVSIDGPGGYHHAFDPPATAAAREHAARIPLGPTGEYVVHFQNDGASAGGWTMAVRLAVPAIAKVTVDIRDRALTGPWSGGSQVFGRVVDSTGGLVDPSSVGGALSGTSVDVGANSVPSTSVIALSASDTFFVDDANHPAGVAVTLTPSGTIFAKPVTVTVPYDPQAFDDPLTELTIYIQNSVTGALEAVPHDQLVINTGAATVSFPTSHFSRFQGTSPKDRPLKGSFVQLELAGSANAAFAGQLVFGLSSLNGLKGPRTGNSFSRTIVRRALTFDATTIGHTGAAPVADGGAITVVDDNHVDVTSTAEGVQHFLRGRTPDVLLQPPTATAPGAATSVLLRVAQGSPTLSNLAGAWSFFVLEFGAAHDAGGAVILDTIGQRGRLTFGLDGVVKASGVTTETASAGAAGTWSAASSKKTPADGNVAVAPGRLTIAMPLGASALIKSVDLVPVLSGDVLVGMADASLGPDKSAATAVMRLLVLVRVPKGVKAAVLGPRDFLSAFGLQPADRPGATQDLGYFGDDFAVARASRRAFTMSGTQFEYAHDASGGPTTTQVPVTQPGTYSLSPDGVYRDSIPSTFGVVSPRTGFYVETAFSRSVFAIGFGVAAPP
jgi:hypothetical protein